MLLAYHDRSDGGLITTISEMLFASRLGVSLQLSGSDHDVLTQLFSEEAGAVVQVAKKKLTQVQMVLDRNSAKATAIGRVENDSQTLTIRRDDEIVLQLDRARLQRDWSETSFKIQALRDNPATAREEFDGILDDDDPGLNAVLTFNPGDNIVQAYRGTAKPRIAVLREQRSCSRRPR